jgi:hypothetical protein
MLRRVALVRTNVSEERSSPFIRVTRFGEVGSTLAVRRLLVTASVVPSSQILVTLMKEALISSETRFLPEPHGITYQKTPFFIVAAVKTSNLTGEIDVLRNVDSVQSLKTEVVLKRRTDMCIWTEQKSV